MPGDFGVVSPGLKRAGASMSPAELHWATQWADRRKEIRRADELADRKKQNPTCGCRAEGRRWLTGRALVGEVDRRLWSEEGSAEFEAGEEEKGKVQNTAVCSWQRSTRHCHFSQPAFPRQGSMGHGCWEILRKQGSIIKLIWETQHTICPAVLNWSD